MDRYFIQALSAITFLAVIDLLVSKSNNGKTVKTVISLISVTILAVPIVTIIKNFTFTSDIEFINYDYTEYLLNLEKEVYKNRIEKALNTSDIEYESVDFEFSNENNPFKLEKIVIKPHGNVIIGSEEHINMSERVNLALENVINLSEVEIKIEAKTR